MENSNYRVTVENTRYAFSVKESKSLSSTKGSLPPITLRKRNADNTNEIRGRSKQAEPELYKTELANGKLSVRPSSKYRDSFSCPDLFWRVCLLLCLLFSL